MDFIDLFYYSRDFDRSDTACNASAKRKAFSVVLPKMIENKLTDKQSVCFRFKYLNNMTQCEIAERLGISQPTVSRHINAAKDILNDSLKYCYVACEMAIREVEQNYLN